MTVVVLAHDVPSAVSANKMYPARTCILADTLPWSVGP